MVELPGHWSGLKLRGKMARSFREESKGNKELGTWGWGVIYINGLGSG